MSGLHEGGMETKCADSGSGQRSLAAERGGPLPPGSGSPLTALALLIAFLCSFLQTDPLSMTHTIS